MNGLAKVVQSQDIDAAKKGVIPQKRKRATEWAVCTFHTWRRYKSEQLPDNFCSNDILLSFTTVTFDYTVN